MKIRLVGAELFHADGRTDMMKLTVDIHNFATTPKKWWDIMHTHWMGFITDGKSLDEIHDVSAENNANDFWKENINLLTPEFSGRSAI